MHKLVYTDEQDLRIYESLPSTDFKEFFMAYFKYKKGDKVELTDFTNPVTFALFNSYIPKLDKNEDTYNKKVQASKENGKKGGRPKKTAIQEVKETEFDIPNCQTPNTADLNLLNGKEVEQPQPTENNTTEAIETTIEEEEFDNNSDVLDNLLDEYENIINHTTDAIAKAEISDEVMVVYQAKQAKLKLKEISEKLIEEIDRTNFYKYINEKIEIKTKKLQVA